ncbi:MAG: DUF4850 domain-containing protein [Acinetobacter sp.]|nr:DUF4850 domain-containing protein [Acinetobacter sp.]
MNIIRQIPKYLLIATLCYGATTAQAEEFYFNLDYPSHLNTLANHQPQLKALGVKQISGVKVAAFNSTFDNPLSEIEQQKKLHYRLANKISTTLTAKQLARVDVYATPLGAIFVPKGWQFIYGGVGIEDGSISMTFVSPKKDGFLSYYNPAHCDGCATTGASIFFEQARKDAQQAGLDYYDHTDPVVQKIQQQEQLINYRLERDGQRIDGIAYYHAKQKYRHWKVEMSSAAAQRDLVQPILKQFIAASASVSQ